MPFKYMFSYLFKIQDIPGFKLPCQSILDLEKAARFVNLLILAEFQVSSLSRYMILVTEAFLKRTCASEVKNIFPYLLNRNVF